MLVHEATFCDEERERAARRLHSTASRPAELAGDAGVRLLALTHISPRYFGRELAREARAIFPATVVPRDFERSSSRSPSGAARAREGRREERRQGG